MLLSNGIKAKNEVERANNLLINWSILPPVKMWKLFKWFKLSTLYSKYALLFLDKPFLFMEIMFIDLQLYQQIQMDII